MTSISAVSALLSSKLLRRRHDLATVPEVAVKWLVTGLIRETIEGFTRKHAALQCEYPGRERPTSCF